MQKGRLRKLRARMRQEGIEAVLITNAANRLYLSGFSGTAGMVLVTTDENLLFTDFRYQEQAAAEAPEFEIVLVRNSFWKTVNNTIRKYKLTTLGFEAESLIFASYERLKENLANVKLCPLKKWVESIRVKKETSERKLLRESVRIAEHAFLRLLPVIKPGVREREIAAELAYLIREGGAERESFDIIAAAGSRSSLPHGKPTEQILRKGDLLVIDFGASYCGYKSDLTRTVVIGKANKRKERIFETVLKAQEQAIRNVRPGIKCAQLDRIARKVINNAGYSKYFGHGLGHGIGLEVHEEPLLNPHAEKVLEPSMTITVEPAVYLPANFGVRVEDDLLVTEQGCEVLSSLPKKVVVE